MPPLKANQVFTPGAFPSHTYIERNGKRYEQQLRDALDTPGQAVSLSGPSKSGKTVLIERVVGKDNLIPITGAGINKPEDVWNRILDWMDVPSSEVATATDGGTTTGGGTLKGSLKAPLIGGVEATLKLEHAKSKTAAKAATSVRRGLTQVVQEIADSDFVVLIDDFHYMPRDVQEEVAKQIKEAIRQGVRIVTAAVKHRSDDVVRALPELRGRIATIDLDYWEKPNLIKIAQSGFGVLRVELPEAMYQEFADEAAGSPQLMQAICLNAAFELDVREERPLFARLPVSETEKRRMFERAATTADFRSLVDVLDSGPKTRGMERKIYGFTDHTSGDVYRCILKAMAADPPQLSFLYNEILERTNTLCTADSPVGSSVVTTCLHMSKLALEKFPKERVIDWDEQKFVFDISDPYLLFYLRWSGRLSEAE